MRTPRSGNERLESREDPRAVVAVGEVVDGYIAIKIWEHGGPSRGHCERVTPDLACRAGVNTKIRPREREAIDAAETEVRQERLYGNRFGTIEFLTPPGRAHDALIDSTITGGEISGCERTVG